MSLRDFNWTETDNDIYELAYKSDDGVLLFVEDRYKNKSLNNQTTFDDFQDERYALMVRNPYKPGMTEVHTSDDWSEVEGYAEYLAGDIDEFDGLD